MEITHTQPSHTATWSLADVVTRLAQHPQVEGVMQIGSRTTTMFTPNSDDDLVIVLADAPQ